MKTIGILGGGQLAKMTALTLLKMGFSAHIYSNDKDSSCINNFANCTIGGMDEWDKLSKFAQQVNVITIESEDIPVSTLKFLANKTYCPLDCNILFVTQNRVREKDFLSEIGLPTTKYKVAQSAEDVKKFALEVGYPVLTKKIESGYDGKGQHLIKKDNDIKDILFPCIAEEFISYTKELSIIVTRDANGLIEPFPIAENVHKNGILNTSTVPANIGNNIADIVLSYAQQICQSFNLIGIIAIEYFLTEDNRIIINEIAPRPHNSGHWSIDACNVSQFEQLVRVICGIRQKKVHLLCGCTTYNILGQDVENWLDYASPDNNQLMIYGKNTVTNNRKMGHVNILELDGQQ